MGKKINYQWLVIPVLVLVFALIGTTCALTVPGDEPTIRVDAEMPYIIQQPAPGLGFKTNADPIPSLTVEGKSDDGGVISYQWMKYETDAEYAEGKGTPATGASAKKAEFTPPATEGVHYYYARVTNTRAGGTTGNPSASIKSNPVIVVVSDPNNAEYPVITERPLSGTHPARADLSVDIVVKTDDSTTGTITYKWYTATGLVTEGGTIIDNANGDTLTVTELSAGTNYYYYVEVTNTNNAAQGIKTATVTIPVSIQVVATNATFTLGSTRAQYVRGFGGMFTPWGNAPQEYLKDFETMFNPTDGLGYNILRIMIFADDTDVRQTMYNVTTNRDEKGKDLADFYNYVKLVNKYGGYVLASPWSPPAAWKTNNSINGGGTLKVANYVHFAQYLNDFCKLMNEKGAPIYAVSHQNEPTFATTNYEGCEYTPTQHRDWWIAAKQFTEGTRGYGGGKAIPRVLTMTGEAHNSVAPFHTGEPGNVGTAALQNEQSRDYIDIVGRHIYGAGVDNLSEAQRHGKEVWMTDHNINSGTGSERQDSTWDFVWKYMHDVDLTIRLNQENAFIWWTAKRYYSMIGDGNFTTIDGAVLPRGWGLSHYAKFAKEMWRIKDVDVSGTTKVNIPLTTGTGSANVNATAWSQDSTDVKVSAFISENGNTVSVVMFTPTKDDGGSGHDMGTVVIRLPAGFEASRATAMRSNANLQGVVENDVIICADKNSAIVTLPSSTILSVRFSR